MSPDIVEAEPAPRLCDFLRSNQPDIIAEWSQRVRSLSPARELSERSLIDHLPRILARIADVVECEPADRPASLQECQTEHVLERLQSGFNLDQIVIEYGLLRRSILDLWEARVNAAIVVAELRTLDTGFDECIRQSTIQYAEAREKLLRALDRVSESALASAEVDPFLEKLLRVVLEGTEAAETCVILLREGDLLRVRAAAGLEEEIGRNYSDIYNFAQ